MPKHEAIQALFGRVAEQLVAESALDTTTESGEIVEVWTIGSALATVRASAPHGSVTPGMLLRCGLAIADRPHAVTMRVAEADAGDGSRDALSLKVVGAMPDAAAAAGVDRIPVEIAATLSSLAEDAPGPMPATFVDLSEAGATLLVATARPQASERYLLEFRSFDGAVSQQLDIRTARPDVRVGCLRLDCAFADPSVETVDIVRQIVSRPRQPQHRPASDIRLDLGLGQSPPSAADRPRQARVRPALHPS